MVGKIVHCISTNPLSFLNDPLWVKKNAKIQNNVFTIDDKEESFYQSNTPFVSETSDSVNVMYYGTIEVPHALHVGPLFVVGHLEKSGRFQVEQKLIDMYNWNSYPITNYQANENKRVYYIRLQTI
jgi:hypothetical protein